LKKRNVGPDVLVGLFLEQSIEAVVAIMGILKAGGAYVPLDWNSPKERIVETIQHAQLTHVVTVSSLKDRLPADLSLVCIDKDLEGESVSNPVITTDADSACYVLYTSGSTGRPKGVVGIHRSIANGLLSAQYEEQDICCLNSSLC